MQFEKEIIRSLSGNGELMLTLPASFAQEESRSISENMKWSTRKRFEQGNTQRTFRVYGYRWEGDELVPVPKEAAIVKLIFQNFLDGKSRLDTEKEFAAEGIKTRNGRLLGTRTLEWRCTTSITYTGNLLLREWINRKSRCHHQKAPEEQGVSPANYAEAPPRGHYRHEDLSVCAGRERQTAGTRGSGQ